jgi:hypothetical protein
MPTIPNVLLCACTILILCVCVGLPLAKCLVGSRAITWALAPTLGWSVFSPLALLILRTTEFTRFNIAILFGVAVVGGTSAAIGKATRARPSTTSIWLIAACAAVALLPASGVWPKIEDNGLVLGAPLFDHSKIAIIEDIQRLGLPAGNPFYGGTDAPPRLVYYYLWHFSAAVFATLTGANGWEADIALTWFTGFASLTLVMGLVVKISGRWFAAPLALGLSLAGSLEPVLRALFGTDLLGKLFSSTEAPQSWLFQATWAPQHLAAASSVVLAVLMLRRLSWLLVLPLAIVAAAGFESSAWVGGIIFAVAALAAGVALLLRAKNLRAAVLLLAQAGAAAALAGAIAYPLLRDEWLATAARHLGLPIALMPYKVLGPLFVDPLRRVLDLPAYWVILLPIAFPAIYPAGAVTIFAELTRRERPLEQPIVLVLALLAAMSFGIPWLFASDIANNDLGWRGVLPGILVLTAFAAAGLSRWLETRSAWAVGAVVGLTLALPGGLELVASNIKAEPLASSAALAETPQMWATVRRYTTPAERIANNPLYFFDSVQWPINISWALFADRRSCYAGWNLARAFVPLPEAELDRLEQVFDRIFAGTGTPRDIDELATKHNCSVVVLTARDGAWNHDPFVADKRFRLVDERRDRWRIYRVIGAE